MANVRADLALEVERLRALYRLSQMVTGQVSTWIRRWMPSPGLRIS